MTPLGTFDPVWGLMTMYTIGEVLVVMLLVMPMPSNQLRGRVQSTINTMWHSQEYVRKTGWVLLTLNSYYFYDAARNLWTQNKILAASCESQQMQLYFQRNILITGGSVFLFFVMRRLLDIQGQLYSMRALAKEAAAAQQQLLGDGSGGGSSGGGGGAAGALERHRELSKTLRRLARSSHDGDEAAAPAAGFKRA